LFVIKPGTRDGRGAKCKKCHNEYCHEFKRLNPEKKERHRLQTLEWGRRNKGLMRAYGLKHNYGITPDHYRSIYENQGGKCAICSSVGAEAGRGVLCVDHDHATGKIRGLLCKLCNAFLGRIRDDHVKLLHAMSYLERNGVGDLGVN
jgi:hypothetical protein